MGFLLIQDLIQFGDELRELIVIPFACDQICEFFETRILLGVQIFS